MPNHLTRIISLTTVILLILGLAHNDRIFAARQDFSFEGVYEASVDLPRILFLLKRQSDGLPLKYQGSYEITWAYLDTGASGIVMSRETRDDMGISVEPGAVFVDFGVGGAQYFDVSEPLYIGTAGHHLAEDLSFGLPGDADKYKISGPWHFQMTREYVTGLLESPLDILGIPVMAGKTVVLNSESTNALYYFHADILEPNDPTIPSADFQVPLRFERYIHFYDSVNIPPEPVLSYNPVIDNITINHGPITSPGTWLLDTGAMLSIMSVAQAFKLGLTDSSGSPIVTPDFYATVGGVGGTVDIPGFTVDELRIPTLSGFHLVFTNARIAVHDIGVYDETNDRYIILDGIFGSNFLAASWDTTDIFNLKITATPFDRVIIDMQNALLGFDVNYAYPLPTCGDAAHPHPLGDTNGDCFINLLDISTLSINWCRLDCSPANQYCDGADISQNGRVNYLDYNQLTGNWGISVFPPACGDAHHPWRTSDFNRNCSMELMDFAIFGDEWLKPCDWLNWNCRGADLNFDGVVNITDLAVFTQIR